MFARYSSSIAKLWVKHNGGQATQVSTAGCVNVSDFADAIKRKLPKQLSAFDPNQITIHKALSDAALEPDLPLSTFTDAGLSAKSPLLVQVPGKTSKVALVLQSNATPEVKQLLLEELFESELKAKESELKSKEDKELLLASNDSLLQELKEKLQGIESDREFLKGTLNARNILEKYEKPFKRENLTRAQYWKRHLDCNPALKARLQECDKDIPWHEKAVDIYKHLSEIVHTDTSRLGGGRFLVMIRKNLPEIDVFFIQAITEQIYGKYVRVNVEEDEEN